MDAPHTALHGQNTTTAGRLYLAFELGEKNWKLSFGDGRRAPTRCTVAAGDTTAVLTAIANARARCHLSADAPVYSCYEAGRGGFWLHRWLAEQGIVNLVVDSAAHPEESWPTLRSAHWPESSILARQSFRPLSTTSFFSNCLSGFFQQAIRPHSSPRQYASGLSFRQNAC